MSIESILQTFTLKPIDGVIIPVAAVGFYAFYRLMTAKVFNPYLDLYHQREAASEGAQDAAVAMQEKAKELTLEYEQKLNASRGELMREKIQKVNAARKQNEKITSEAEGKAHHELTVAREAIQSERKQKEATLEEEANKLADSIVQKLSAPTSASL